MKQRSPLSDRAILLVGVMAFVTAAMLSMCATGCKSPTPGTPAAWIKIAAVVAQNAATIGCSSDLKAHPERRAAYETAASALTALIDRSQWDPVQFAAVIQKLPVPQLDGSQGALYAAGIATVFDLATSTLIDINSAPAVEAVMRAVRDGLRVALLNTPTVPATRLLGVKKTQPAPAKVPIKIPPATPRVKV